MWYIITACVVGFIGGWGSVSRGRFFRRRAGAAFLGVCLFAELGLSIYAWISRGFWMGVWTFLASWLLCAHLGAYAFRFVYRSSAGR